MERYSWLNLQLLLDSALPVGSFAHSYGLETLVQEGAVATGEHLRLYLEAMLRQSWSTSDLMAVKAVYVGPPNEEAAKDYAYRVERVVHFQRLGAETRDGVEKTGRRLLRLAPSLFPSLPLGDLSADIREGRALGTYPLVFGVLCLRLGVPLDRAAEGYLYACASTSVNAALRLMSIGQNEAQRLLAGSFPVIEEAWNAVRGMDPEDAYGAMPLAELAMIRHEKLYSRLFMS